MTVQDQIYQTLKLKETDELLAVWRQNDHTEWTDAAFAALAQLLQERLGQLPPQKPPLYTKDGVISSDEFGFDAVAASDKVDEDDELKLYHDPERLLNVALLAERWAWMPLGVFCLVLIIDLGSYIFPFTPTIQPAGEFFKDLLLTGLIALVSHLVLRLIPQVVYILLDIVDFTSPEGEAKD